MLTTAMTSSGIASLPGSSAWLAGFTVCLSLIVSIGAQNLYVLRQAVQGRYVRECVAWCVISDAALVALGVAGMSQLLQRSPALAYYLTLGGAAFLLAYGLFSLHRMYKPAEGDAVAGLDTAAASTAPNAPNAPNAPSAPSATGQGLGASRSLLSVLAALMAITLLNPHVYLDTVLLMGSIGAQQQGHGRWFYVLGAACASLSWFVLLAAAGQRLQHVFAKRQAWRVLDGLTGVMMLALAVWVASSARDWA